MTEVEQPPQNGIELSAAEDDDSSKARPADIEQDMREMERRKRVEAIMSSKFFREELERIVDSARDAGNASGILQQLSDIVGMPSSRVGSVFKASNCMIPINDIRGVESMGYAKGEKILRCKLAATFRLLDLNGWTQGLGAQITARLKVDQEYFLVNPYGLMYHEITASALNKVDMQGQIVEQGTTNFGVNKSHFILHSVVHAARPDIRCAIYIGCSPVVAVSSLKTGLLPITKDACVLGEITTHPYSGSLYDIEERDRLVRNLGPNSKVLILTNYGALCCGETIEEAFFAACHIVQACETQLKLLPVGVDNLVLIPEESRKIIYEQSRRPPEDLEKKFAAVVSTTESTAVGEEGGVAVKEKVVGAAPKWRVGGAEFEALMRMLDNAGFRTGYIYRHPLIKSDPPKPKNDVELPPAVSSLGYLLEEEELFRQGIWKKGDLRKGGDRSRWLNSPNVYQKVEVLETGTPDPKKITKWVAEGSPTHSTPVRIEDPLQFVPAGTNPKEFKRLQQQIKDNRRADKISAGPQSHILEGVTWDEANRIKDATVSSAGDHVVLMGAASKGIIQRGFQHNATVYKAPYAKNPFDNVTDDELNEYKRTVERKKKSIHGEYTDTDFSESEALSSLPTSGAQHTKQTTTTTAAVSQSEPEDISEHQVMRIETQQAPVPSQPEVVLSDATLSFINGERSHTATNRKPPTGRDTEELLNLPQYEKVQEILSPSSSLQRERFQANKENICPGKENAIRDHSSLIAELKNDVLFQRQKSKISQREQEPIHIIAKQHSNSNRLPADDVAGAHTPPTTSAPTSPIPPGAPQNNQFAHFEQNFSKMLMPRNHGEIYSYCYEPPSEQCYDSVYDTAYCPERFEAQSDDPENPYKKSIFCCTPTVCDTIFEALRKPPIDNNLIFNIPFAATSSPTNTTTSSTPRKTRADTPQKQCQAGGTTNNSSSPYRTVSHFGFNSPQREPQPEHKHMPCPSEPKKYVPLRKSVSYEEIFSSPRYIDLCENCFEKIVRLKPELVNMRMRLRNLVDFANEPATQRVSTGANSDASLSCRAGSGSSTTDMPRNANGALGMLVFPQTTTDLPQYEYLEYASSENTEALPPFSSQLEPVLEVEECELESSEDAPKSMAARTAERTLSRTSFIEKIMRMNYSEESANANFTETPYTIHSNFTLDADKFEELDGNNNTEAITNNAVVLRSTVPLDFTSNSTTDNSKEQDASCVEQHTSVTEIWEFGNWQGSSRAQSKSSSETTCTLNMESNAAHDNVNEQALKQQRRSLMSREERGRRKLVFQELWEDHIAFFSGKEQSALSDTESAIDETAEKQQQAQTSEARQTVEQHVAAPTMMEDAEQEVFLGRSLIVKTPVMFEQPSVEELPEATAYEQEDSDGLRSARTYNVSDSRESLFFRAMQHVEFNVDCARSGVPNEAARLDQLMLTGRRSLEEGVDEDDILGPQYTSSMEEFELYAQKVGDYIEQTESIGDLKPEDKPKSVARQQDVCKDLGKLAREQQRRTEREIKRKAERERQRKADRACQRTKGRDLFRKYKHAGNQDKRRSQAAFEDTDSEDDKEVCEKAQLPEAEKVVSQDFEQNVEALKAEIKQYTAESEIKLGQENDLNAKKHEMLENELSKRQDKTVKTRDVNIKAANKAFNVSPDDKENNEVHANGGNKDIERTQSELSYRECISPQTELKEESYEQWASAVSSDQESQFAELVEFSGQEDLIKLSEEFEEILIDVQDLATAPTTTTSAKAEQETAAQQSKLSDTEDENLEFNDVERKILKKIKINQFKESEEIFDKIEATIRNKLTPQKIESLVKSQQQQQCLNKTSTEYNDDVPCTSKMAVSLDSLKSHSSSHTFTTSTPRKDDELSLSDSDSASLNEEKAHRNRRSEHGSCSDESSTTLLEPTELEGCHQRRSRSLTPFTERTNAQAQLKLNKTTTPAQTSRLKLNPPLESRAQPLIGATLASSKPTLNTADSTHSTPEFYEHGQQASTSSIPTVSSMPVSNASRLRRNFIQENIRNAAIPRNSLKRLQSNTPSLCSSKSTLGSTTKLWQISPSASSTTLESCNDNNLCCIGHGVDKANNCLSSGSTQVTERPSSTSTVYSFQSNLVRGSPRFWMSLAQTPTVKLSASKNLHKRRKHNQQQQQEMQKAAHHHQKSASRKRTRHGHSTSGGSVVSCESVIDLTALPSTSAAAAARLHCKHGKSPKRTLREELEFADAVDSNSGSTFLATTRVEEEIEALGEQIQQLQPRLESYKRKFDTYVEHVTQCSHNMDECISVQRELTEEQRQQRETAALQQYADEVSAHVQTYSISETED